MANTLTLLVKMPATVRVFRGHRQTLCFVPRIISLFIMCIEILWNNSLLGRCTLLDWGSDWTPNLGYRARHALLRVAPKWFDHWTTWAGPITEFCQMQHSLCIQILRSPILAALLYATWAVDISKTLRRGIFTRQGGHPVRHWAVELSSLNMNHGLGGAVVQRVERWTCDQ